MVDTIGLLIVVLVTAASVLDGDDRRLVLDRARMKMPSLALVWADGGYAGRCVVFSRRWLRITVEIVRKLAGQRTVEVLPRRWMVERALSWLTECRRLSHDYERLPAYAEAMVKWADDRVDNPLPRTRPGAPPRGGSQGLHDNEDVAVDG